MRLKYYLRGAGIGMIVTTLVLTIAFSLTKPSVSENSKQKEEIVNNQTLKEAQEESEKNKPKENASNADTKEDVKEMVTFTINRGDSSATVCERLQELGLVDDKDSFDKYLSSEGYDNNLQPGEYSITKGCSYEDLSKLLITKNE